MYMGESPENSIRGALATAPNQGSTASYMRKTAAESEPAAVAGQTQRPARRYASTRRSSSECSNPAASRAVVRSLSLRKATGTLREGAEGGLEEEGRNTSGTKETLEDIVAHIKKENRCDPLLSQTESNSDLGHELLTEVSYSRPYPHWRYETLWWVLHCVKSSIGNAAQQSCVSG
jgi:hypothetical protein